MNFWNGNEEWSINGHRVVKRTGLLTDTLVVLDAAGLEQCRRDLIGGNEWEVPIGARTYRLVRRRGKDGMGVGQNQLDLRSANDQLVAPGRATFLQPIAAPADTRCTKHQEVAAIQACARCGIFSCEDCLSADAVVCATCYAPSVQAHARAQSAAVWAGPAAVFLWGGPLGIALGLIAAGAAVAYAKRVPRERFSPWVPAAIYLAAMVLWAAAVRSLTS